MGEFRLRSFFRRFSNQVGEPLAAPRWGIARPEFRLPCFALGLLLASVVLCVLILFLQRFLAVTTVSFQLAVRDATPGGNLRGCFYFDTGHGFSEAEKTCFRYGPPSPNQFQDYLVILPTRWPVLRLRFAPLREPGTIALRSLAMGRSRARFTPASYRRTVVDLKREFGHSLYPLHDSPLSLEGESLVARLSTADAYFMLSDQLDRQTALDIGAILRAEIIALLICFIAAVLWTLVPRTKLWAHLRDGVVWVRHDPSLAASIRGTVLWMRGSIPWLLVLLAVYSMVLLVEQLRTPTTVSFEIAIREADIWGRGFYPCFFYDTGHGFSETETVCFDYHQGLQAGFQRYQITLPTHRTVHQLRFDPLAEPGVIALRNLRIGRYRFAEINLAKEFGHTLYPLHQTQLSIEGDTLVARLSTTDPHFMLVDGFDRRTGPGARVVLQRIATSLLLWAGLFALVEWARKTGRWQRNETWLGLARRRTPQLFAATRAVTLAALAAFWVAMIGGKAFALLTSAFHYGRAISLADLAVAPAESAALGLLAMTVVLLLVGADDLCARSWWTTPLRVLLFACESLVASVLVLLALFEILCCYVFWEWGSYLDRSLIEIAYHSPTPDSLRYYLTRPPAAIVALAVVAVAWFGVFSFRFFRRRGIPRGLVVALASIAAIWSLEALKPLRAPDGYDPAVSSPMVVAQRSSYDLGEALDSSVDAPKLADFHLPPPRPVPAAYQHYLGAAAGQDVIFVVLESVRRADVSLYGYARETTPNMERLSHHAMVFSNVYVSQPRSCKTMESFTLGTYPDPRFDSLAWDADRILGHPSFWSILSQHGYKVYLGVNADVENDGFGAFMRAAAGPALDRTVGQSYLTAHYGEIAKPVGSMGNDTVMVDDFLQWYRARKGPAAAVVWFAEAHHPYWATTKKFSEHGLVDQYDNCIYSADAAIGHLVDELEKTGRHPLVLIFGDHGESFGEHAGDRFHGRYLYNQSVRIPMMLYDSAVFPERQDFDGRISMKDVPATIFYLLGQQEPIGQSEVAFSKQPGDLVYMSNVYGGFKLGMVDGLAPEKFMYFPSTKLDYLFDLATDPGEETNLVPSRSPEEIRQREQELIQWYFYQTHYLDQEFPRRLAVSAAKAPQ